MIMMQTSSIRVIFQHQQQHHQNHHHQQHRHHAAPNFQESYPYPASSRYYEPNHLLFHLHMERVQRQQQFEDGRGGQPSSRSLSPEDPLTPGGGDANR